jgi:hypothetical protein
MGEPKDQRINQLCKTAVATARGFGHRISLLKGRPGALRYNADATLIVSTCDACQAKLVIQVKPKLNKPDISGDAVAVRCKTAEEEDDE